ncbi:MAG: NADH dehydrogenase subunit, partial [Alistipes onderdonkii]
MDISCQLGQVACEALRTVVISSVRLWCGNRFSKGLIRPFGSHYPLSGALREMILKNLSDVERRYGEVARCLSNEPSVLGRLEDCGVVPAARASRIGAVGPAARASGLVRDVR